MSLRDTVKDWLREGKEIEVNNPLCSKRLVIKNLNPNKRPISAVADNIEVRNANIVTVKIKKEIKFKLMYDKNQSLNKKIKIEQSKNEH